MGQRDSLMLLSMEIQHVAMVAISFYFRVIRWNSSKFHFVE